MPQKLFQDPFIRVLKRSWHPFYKCLACAIADIVLWVPPTHSSVLLCATHTHIHTHTHTSQIHRFLKCLWSTWSSSNIQILQISNFYFCVFFHCDFSIIFLPQNKPNQRQSGGVSVEAGIFNNRYVQKNRVSAIHNFFLYFLCTFGVIV